MLACWQRFAKYPDSEFGAIWVLRLSLQLRVGCCTCLDGLPSLTRAGEYCARSLEQNAAARIGSRPQQRAAPTVRFGEVDLAIASLIDVGNIVLTFSNKMGRDVLHWELSQPVL